MLPEERPPLVGVAAGAQLVYGNLADQLLRRRPMGVVAARAGELPLLCRHVGCALELHVPHLMALAAQISLGRLLELPLLAFR